jgi:hypothetical protein
VGYLEKIGPGFVFQVSAVVDTRFAKHSAIDDIKALAGFDIGLA